MFVPVKCNDCKAAKSGRLVREELWKSGNRNSGDSPSKFKVLTLVKELKVAKAGKDRLVITVLANSAPTHRSS